jgi:hypothetical protein
MSNVQLEQDNTPFATHHLKDAQARWERLTPSDLAQVKTKAQLIARVQERYCLPHEVAAEEVEIWALDRRF